MTLEVSQSPDIATCHLLRKLVFIDEQAVPVAIERDGRDGEALHILARLDGAPVGCARILIAGETGKIGRVCVLQSHRGNGIGSALVQACIDQLQGMNGITRAELGAQTHALGLYERLGFSPYGEEFADAGGQPHRMMERPL